MLSIVHDCSDSGLNCTLSICSLLLSVISFTISIISVYRIYCVQSTLLFEVLPLSCSIILSLLQIIQSFFINDIRLLLTGEFIQSVIFSFVALSFAMLYHRMNHENSPVKDIKVKKIAKSIFGLFILVIIGLFITSMITLQESDCKDWFSRKYYIPLGCSAIASLVGTAYGIFLRNIIVRQENNSQSDLSTQSFDDTSFSSSNFHKELRQQVKSILFMYTALIMIQISLSIIREQRVESTITCTNGYTYRTEQPNSQVFLFLMSIVEVAPCFVIPYVYYYIPFAKRQILRTTSDLVLKLRNEQFGASFNSFNSSTSEEQQDHLLENDNSLSTNSYQQKTLSTSISRTSNEKSRFTNESSATLKRAKFDQKKNFEDPRERHSTFGEIIGQGYSFSLSHKKYHENDDDTSKD